MLHKVIGDVNIEAAQIINFAANTKKTLIARIELQRTERWRMHFERCHIKRQFHKGKKKSSRELEQIALIKG